MRTPERRFHRRQLRIHCFLSANILQLRFQLAVGGFAQVFEFFGFEFTHFAGLDIQNQRSVANAANLLDVMSDLLKHLAQLAVATLDDDDFVPGIVALADFANLGRRGMHTTRTRFATLNGDAGPQAIEFFFGGLTADLDQISLLDARGGFRELIGEVAVVSDQQQALAQVVQPADRIEALAQFREELHHCRPLLRITDCSDESPRLVEHEVAQAFRPLQQLAVDADVVAGGIGLGAEFRDDLAIHLHAAFGNQVLGMTAAGDSGLRQDLLQAFKLAG